MDAIKFTNKYENFSQLINDCAMIIAHYENNNLVVGYDIYMPSLTVEFEIKSPINGKG